MTRLALSVALMTAFAGIGVPAPSTTLARSQPSTPTYAGQARDGYADLAGVRVFFVDSGGTGVPVVLLHAGTGSSRVWEHQFPPFIAAGYRVIAYDRRGHGRTVVTATGQEPSTAADDLEALMAHLRVDRFHLVGTAAGGMVAADYVQSFPHRLRSLVIANSIVGVQDDDYVSLGRRIRPAEFAQLPPEFRELGPSYRAANPEGVNRWVALEHVSRAPGPRTRAQTWKNRTTYESLSAIKTPVLLITGEADLYTPPPVLQLVAQRIRHAQTLTLREVGHSAYWEKPDEFNRAVLDFIRQH